MYEKGAEVIRMQHTLLGPERFRRGMDLDLERHDGMAVTCDDFAQAMGDASQIELTQFRRWYSQAGTPVVTVRGTYDAAALTYTLDIVQSTPPTPGQHEKEPFHIPFAVGLVDQTGRDIPLRIDGEAAPVGTTRALDVREARQSFRFAGINAPPVPSLLRGFSAPVKVEFAYTDGELAFLAAHDSDAVNRWDAAQCSFANAVLALARDERDGKPLALPRSLTGIIGKLLADRASDPALLALSLTPPDPTYVAELATIVHADGVVAAHAFLIRELARTLRSEFERTYHERRVRASYAPTPDQTGSRKLRQHVPALSGLRRRRRGTRARRRPFRRGRQHDGHRRRAVGAEGRRVRGARRAVRALRSEAARRAARPRQVVHARGHVSRADTLARARALPPILVSRRNPNRYGRWSARSPCAISRGSTRPTATPSRPIRR